MSELLKDGAAAHLWYSHLFKCYQPITWRLSGVITPQKWLAGSFLLRLAGSAGCCHLIYWRWRHAGAVVDWPPRPRCSTPYLLLHVRQRGGGERIKNAGYRAPRTFVLLLLVSSWSEWLFCVLVSCDVDSSCGGNLWMLWARSSAGATNTLV